MILIVGLGVLAVPIYAMVGALMWHYLHSRYPDAEMPISEFAGLFWPTVLPIYLLIVWPVMLALRLPSWWKVGEARKASPELPRATTVKR